MPVGRERDVESPGDDLQLRSVPDSRRIPVHPHGDLGVSLQDTVVDLSRGETFEIVGLGQCLPKGIDQLEVIGVERRDGSKVCVEQGLQALAFDVPELILNAEIGLHDSLLWSYPARYRWRCRGTRKT